MDHSYTKKEQRGSCRKSNRKQQVVKQEFKQELLPFGEDVVVRSERLDREIPSLQIPFYKRPCKIAYCKYIEYASEDRYWEHFFNHYDEQEIKNNTCKRCKVYIRVRKSFDQHVKVCDMPFPTNKLDEEKITLPLSRRRRLSKPELKRRWLMLKDECIPKIKETTQILRDARKELKVNILPIQLKLNQNIKVYLETFQKQIFPVKNVTLSKDDLDRIFSKFYSKPSISTSIAPKSNYLLQKIEQPLYIKTESPDSAENAEEDVEQVLDMDLDEDIKPPVLRPAVAVKTKDSSLTNITANLEGVNMGINQRDIKQPILDILASSAESSVKMGGLYCMKSPVTPWMDIKEEDSFSSVSRHSNKRGRPNKKDSIGAPVTKQNFPTVEPERVIKREIRSEPAVKVEPMINNTNKRKRGVSESRNEGKVYHCDKCTYATKEQGNFKRHIGTHVKTEIKQEPQSSRRNRKSEKPLVKCKLCPFASKETGNFSRHMSTHGIPERNSIIYNCDECGFTAKGYNAINFHTLREHNFSSMHNCDICPASYKTSVELKEHRYEHAYLKADEKLFSEGKPKPASASARRSRRKR